MSARQLLLKGQCLLLILWVGQVESCSRHMRVSTLLCSTVQPAGQCSGCPLWSQEDQGAGTQQHAAVGSIPV